MPAPAILIVALVMIQFSTGSAKTIMTEENALGLALFRVTLGTALLWVLSRPEIRSLDRRAWTDAALLGLAYAFFNIAAYSALVHLQLGLLATIGFLGPLAVSLLGSRRPIDFVWPVLGFVGVCLLAPTSPGSQIAWSSIGYGLLYAVSWAIYILASARAGRSLRGLDGFVIAGPIAALCLLPTGYATVGQFMLNTEILMMAVMVTVLVTIPFGMEFIALKRMEPRVFGVLLSLEPAIASVIGIFLLGEILPVSSWLAILIVTSAAFGAALVRQQTKWRPDHDSNMGPPD